MRMMFLCLVHWSVTRWPRARFVKPEAPVCFDLSHSLLHAIRSARTAYLLQSKLALWVSPQHTRGNMDGDTHCTRLILRKVHEREAAFAE
jgi:hypothetical protein